MQYTPVALDSRAAAVARSTSDAALFAAWRGGDARACATLFARHTPALRCFFRKRLPSTPIDDLIQTTLLGCLEARDRFRGDCTFRTFLFSIAVNQVRRHLYLLERGRRRQRELIRVAVTREPEPTPCARLIDQQRRGVLMSGLRRLSDEQQRLIALYYWRRRSARAIAELLDVPVGTVKTRVRRARQKLARVLKYRDVGVEGRGERVDFERWAQELVGGMDGVAARVEPPRERDARAGAFMFALAA